MHGTVSQIASTMRQLQALGPARGYFPEPAKSIFLGRPETSARAREVLEKFNFKFLDGYSYIGCFIGTQPFSHCHSPPLPGCWQQLVPRHYRGYFPPSQGHHRLSPLH